MRVADRPILTLLFWIFFSTGIIMLSSYVAWNRHDKRNEKRQREMAAKKAALKEAGQEGPPPFEPFRPPHPPPPPRPPSPPTGEI
jgi:hypothetical protein